MALLFACRVGLGYVYEDEGETWGAFTGVAQFVELYEFEEAYRATSGDGAWSAGVAAVDPERVSRSVGAVATPPLFLASPTRYRLVVDEGARVAALFEPRAPSAELLADGRTACVWDRELVRALRAA
ncbi:MAG TPA: hypothetical protein VJP77_08790, partial [Planctomycetota bacterium]|nr:hypothetical protein [Planctomycetota bacterium]